MFIIILTLFCTMLIYFYTYLLNIKYFSLIVQISKETLFILKVFIVNINKVGIISFHITDLYVYTNI